MTEPIVVLNGRVVTASDEFEADVRIVDGKINKYVAEICLLEQAFVKDPDVKVGKLAKKAGAEIVSFVRYEVGEGIERAEVDFAAEVAAQVAATKQ